MQIRTGSPQDATFVVRADSKAQRKVFGAMALIGGLVTLGGLVQLLVDLASPAAWGLTVIGLAILAHTLIEWRRQLSFPVLAVGPEHIWFRIGTRHLVAVPWTQVTGVRSTSHGGFWFLCVDADEAAAELEETAPKLWQKTAAARNAHETPFAITDSGKDQSRFKIAAEVDRQRAAANPASGDGQSM
ncbi:hypothetical protein [Phytomonospora endophytica]|uniref:Uncharacterized protein n=1 Tax=Phytomonospora endophytica TaxID=714109 RepID=A0A841FS20_9ACTN|nr:hypothetical protein [Phytomonospora endophytica]MBB6036548.1 hypothetical protein [Phytomonospora endophytica]GIG65870.1 hypothetical protein Pen01_21650 [Phytomonospora endophytica]